MSASPAARRSATRSCRWRCSSRGWRSSTRPISGLDIDALRTVADGVNRPARPDARHARHHPLPAPARLHRARPRARAGSTAGSSAPAARSWRSSWRQRAMPRSAAPRRPRARGGGREATHGSSPRCQPVPERYAALFGRRAAPSCPAAGTPRSARWRERELRALPQRRLPERPRPRRGSTPTSRSWREPADGAGARAGASAATSVAPLARRRDRRARRLIFVNGHYRAELSATSAACRRA